MTFSAPQVRKLRSKLRPQHVKTRELDGLSLSYLEGWHVIAEANRIFGFDGWDRETISSECVWTKQVNGRYCAAYVTRVRIRVRAAEAVIIREGSGAGESSAATPGQAYEFAAKAAETDATKRALMTFGNAFGLSLYGGTPEPRVKATAGSGSAERVPAELSGTSPENGSQEPGEKPLQPEDVPAEPEVAGDNAQPQATQRMLPVTLPGPNWPPIAPLDEAVLLDQERRERIDKSALVLSEPRRIRDLGHLAFVASKPCLVCGRNRAPCPSAPSTTGSSIGMAMSAPGGRRVISTRCRWRRRCGMLGEGSF